MRKALALIKAGSVSPEVSYAKRMINRASSDGLFGFSWIQKFNADDQRFSDGLRKAVLAFQEAAGFGARDIDGVIGNQTWGALGVQLAITYPLKMVPQPRRHTCFDSTARMILHGHAPKLGKTIKVGFDTASGKIVEVADGRKKPIAHPEALKDTLKLHFNGGLWMGVDAIHTDLDNLKLFARRNGWQTKVPPVTLEDVAEWLGGGPVVVGGFLVNPGHETNPGHAVVISAIWTDWTPGGTLVRVHDPFPIGRGAIYATQLNRFHRASREFQMKVIYLPQPGSSWHGSYQIWEDNIPTLTE